jgi:hypothetical protein
MLTKLLGWSFVVAVIVLGVVTAAAVGWLTKEVAAYLMLCCVVVCGTVIGRRFNWARLRQQPRGDKLAEPSVISEKNV